MVAPLAEQLECGVLALVPVVWGKRGLVVQLVLFVVLASVPLVLIASVAMVEYMVVVVGWTAGVMMA